MPRITDIIALQPLPDILADRIVLPPFFFACRQKILIVADGSISFGTGGFALSKVLHILENNPEWWAKFELTCAHRASDFAGNPVPTEAGGTRSIVENFRFTTASLAPYHQVWLFGINLESTPSTPRANATSYLETSELEALARWMDGGGGLLAMGDHEDLGAGLCSEVPRVRSMRRWTNAQGVPPAGGESRHDTDVKGDDAFYQSSDQSDSHPMYITPKYYSLHSWSPFFRRRAPHPILCGTNGVIDILPDHPHEGWVYEDSEIDVTKNFSFGAYTNKPEYPTGAYQPKPEVIAWAHVQPDHTSVSDTFKGAADAKTFGAIGAYNGHDANVGRVVVDSTWHHWFNVNLVGFGPVHPVSGMTATQARIANYFRNVALWLSPKTKIACMFQRATWGSLFIYPLIEELHPRLPIWKLGEYARDAIGRRASQCTLINWIDILLPREIIEVFRPRKPLPDPCLTCPPFELLEIFTLGGIVRELLPLAQQALRDGKVADRAVAKAIAKGIAAGMSSLVEMQEQSVRDTQINVKKLRGALGKLSGEETFIIKEDAPQKNVAVKKGKARR